jgi:hypothetical protein
VFVVSVVEPELEALVDRELVIEVVLVRDTELLADDDSEKDAVLDAVIVRLELKVELTVLDPVTDTDVEAVEL